MTRIENAQKKSEKTNKAIKYILIKKVNEIADDMFNDHRRIYMKEFNDDWHNVREMWRKSRNSCFPAEGGQIDNAKWVVENHKIRNAHTWRFYSKATRGEGFTDDRCYNPVSEYHKQYCYFYWKLMKMNEEQKKIEFYQAMINRDYKAVTLNDDVVREIFEYL